jgi:hypothetical protein
MDGMEQSETKRCDNLSCVCEVPIAQDACSEHCARAEHGDGVTLRCECGHDTCAQEMDRELTGTMGAPAAP